MNAEWDLPRISKGNSHMNNIERDVRFLKTLDS